MVAFSIPTYPGSVRFDYTLVDPFATYSLATEVPGWSQAIGGNTVYQGECDHEALMEAIDEAAAPQPLFNSYLAAMGPPWRQQLIWRHVDKPVKCEFIDLRDAEAPATGIADWVNDKTGLSAFEPDLTVEFPARFRIVALPGDRHAFGWSLHHAAGDIGIFGPFFRRVWAGYDMRISGARSRFASHDLDAPVAQSPQEEQSTISMREFARLMRKEAKEYPRKLTAQPVGTSGRPRRIAASIQLDGDLTVDLRARARAAGATITDVAVAASQLAIAEWNSSHGEPALVQRHNVAVGQRARTAEGEGPNQVSMITVCTKQGDWDDADELLAKVSAVRRKRMEQGCDLIFNRISRRGLRALSVLPVQKRLEVLRRGSRPDQSLLVSNQGVSRTRDVHPRQQGAAQTMSIGGMEAIDRAQLGMAMPHYPQSMSLATRMSGRLQVRVGSNEGAMTQDELTRFHKLVVDRMLAYAD